MTLASPTDVRCTTRRCAYCCSRWGLSWFQHVSQEDIRRVADGDVSLRSQGG
jgi:hypothetical protein